MFNYLVILQNSVLILLLNGILFKSVLSYKHRHSVVADENEPDMCLHESRMDSLTQFVYFNNNQLRVAYFFTSGGYYWIISSKEYPSHNNTRGRLPHGFRGDASFFRQWERCEDMMIVPIIVVVDGNETDIKYMMFFIHNQTWSGPYNATEDPALKLIYLYDGLKTVDAIMNFANIKVGPYSDKLGAESIFIISSAQNNTIFYDWVKLTGCVETKNRFEFNGTALNFFGPPLERSFWPMNQSIDTAMIYNIYPNANPNESPKDADISMFYANTHYMFTVPLHLIENGFLHCNKESLLAQYYSTWMGCAEGLTPEPPIYITMKPTKATPGQNEPENEPDFTKQIEDDDHITTWRPPIQAARPSFGNHSHQEEDTFRISVISALIVITVVGILITISLVWVVFRKKEDIKEEIKD